ncbi:mannonate dehydratase [Spirosoma sp. BT702]|uniref:mannonate dehydratase n=1 Tax=Spirosoma profusum TaxID=2771354 RepID=A0A926XWW9_9BACT|nr:mannonate dehydratase [Spirosoma profusum]MBD2702172.1 mannonate dehydratase [Spirosoma profusum]
MKNSRRKFIRQSAVAATLPFANVAATTSGELLSRAKDADLHMCLAYFFGFETQKMKLSTQMNVLGAVAPASAGLAGLPDGKSWQYDVLKALKDRFAGEGLTLRVIESPTPLDKAKLGLDGKDEEIEHFITFMKNLSKVGVDTVCYNWMPVINWSRTKMDKPSRGGALVSSFNYEESKNQPVTQFGEFSAETMWKNLEYFLKAVVPEAEKAGIKLALHPDDPPIDKLRGISRIMTSADAFKKMLALYPSPNNGITMCQGSFATMGEDIPTVVKYFGEQDKIFFVHFRDIRGNKLNFEETFYDDGQNDMYKAMQAYYDIGFKGAIRPDHVPTMAGDSNEHQGYSLLGSLHAVGYMQGLMEAIRKQRG